MLLCFAVSLSACGDWVLIFETRSSDEGGGTQALEQRGSTVRLRSSGVGLDRRASGELTAAGLDALTAARAAVSRAIADSVEPCPLADATSLIHHLEDDEGSFTLVYCQSPTFALAGAEALVDVVGSIVVGLRSCEDNAILAVKRPCSPAS